jgi:hypothetical protein
VFLVCLDDRGLLFLRQHPFVSAAPLPRGLLSFLLAKV